MLDKKAVLEYVELSTAALDDAHNKLAAVQAQQSQYLEEVNKTVDRMVAAGSLRKDAAAHAATVLANPIQALRELAELSATTAGQAPADKIGTVGQSGHGKAAAVRSEPNSRRQADIDFLKGLGLPTDMV